MLAAGDRAGWDALVGVLDARGAEGLGLSLLDLVTAMCLGGAAERVTRLITHRRQPLRFLPRVWLDESKVAPDGTPDPAWLRVFEWPRIRRADEETVAEPERVRAYALMQIKRASQLSARELLLMREDAEHHVHAADDARRRQRDAAAVEPSLAPLDALVPGLLGSPSAPSAPATRSGPRLDWPR